MFLLNIKMLTLHIDFNLQQFDNVIKALEEGKEIDLSQMPPPPEAISGML